MRVVWRVTSQCNADCYHCYVKKEEKDDFSTKEAFEIIERITEIKNPVVILSGGEALLREDIHEIIGYGKAKGVIMRMGSNGKLVTKKVAKELRESGLSQLAISIEGTQKTHDLMRGEGSFRKAVQAIENCNEVGLASVINCCLTKVNLGEFSEILDIAEKLNIEKCFFGIYLPVGNALGKNQYSLNSSELTIFLKNIYHEQKIRGIQILIRNAPCHIVLPARENKPVEENEIFPGCAAGINRITITANGDMLPCAWLPFLRIGNIKEISIKEAMESNIVKELRDHSFKGRCGRCKHRKICGGCRARAYLSYGDYLQEDPLCTDEFYEKAEV